MCIGLVQSCTDIRVGSVSGVIHLLLRAHAAAAAIVCVQARICFQQILFPGNASCTPSAFLAAAACCTGMHPHAV